jgi:hypothetical protein
MTPKTPENLRKQSQSYYRLNALAKNRHDLTRRWLQRSGLMDMHRELSQRIQSGEISPDLFLERDVYCSSE